MVIGDVLVTPDGTVTLDASRVERWPAIVYNFRVPDLHTYYVLAGGTPVLVHNANYGNFVPSPKHGKTQRGNAAPGPTNGQGALDSSVGIGPNTARRIGIDKENDEFVVFDETLPGKGEFHGHVRTWEGLNQQMQNALYQSGLVNRKGKMK
jgi:hypothetical protein